jgi:hypothetical protein
LGSRQDAAGKVAAAMLRSDEALLAWLAGREATTAPSEFDEPHDFADVDPAGQSAETIRAALDIVFERLMARL